jgi:hypothetical protein
LIDNAFTNTDSNNQDKITFENGKDIDITNITGIENGKNLDGTLNTLFGNEDHNSVRGYEGTLILK